MAQKRVPEPFLTCLWVILCEPLLLFGQFHGSTHPPDGQFHGTCLEKPQPKKRTFPGRTAPPEPTFGGFTAPNIPPLRLILLDLTNNPTPGTQKRRFCDFDCARDHELARPLRFHPSGEDLSPPAARPRPSTPATKTCRPPAARPRSSTPAAKTCRWGPRLDFLRGGQ
jgi:hypothetical protein